jgi:hypothetical protein
MDVLGSQFDQKLREHGMGLKGFPQEGTLAPRTTYRDANSREVSIMDGIIYLIGLIVIVMAILSFFGLR